ncbi:hypothetical protein JXB41_00590 [Candidatus Woesearchaeota archaeon]|nr:hypothetical protein [Candidatus Woesearchaeota archaeon]
MKNKILSLLIVLMILSMTFVSVGACIGCYGEDEEPSDIPVYNCEVEINGEDVPEDKEGRVKVDRGEELEIKVKIKATEKVENVQIDAQIIGYERKSLYDSTGLFDLKANDVDTFYLSIVIPDDMDLDDDKYKLRIYINNQDGETQKYSYNLRIASLRHSVVIKDIVLDPSNEVVSGRGLLASVRVKNMGDRDEEGIKISVSIPALGLEASEYIDELELDESTTSEDLYLRIPKCVDEGTYVVKAKVEYDDGYETNSKETSIDILEDETCDYGSSSEEEKTIITVPGKQDIKQNEGGVVYPIMISNTGATSKTYTLSVAGVDSWGTYRIDPSNVIVVNGRKTQTAYLYLSANEDASVGEKIFMVSIESAGETEQVPLTVNIVEGKEEKPAPAGDWESIKKGLEIGLVVLVVLLVILGLIVGFNKLKGSEEEPEEISGQTYY